jgi:hypothetical protein
MSVPAFPTLSSGSKPDSSTFGLSFEDQAMRTETEGGYVFTRARHTRAPRKTWAFGYKQLTNADRVQIESFITLVRGGSVIFTWQNPQDLVTYNVRFKDLPKFGYEGVGNTQRWNCSMTLEQA